MGKYLVVGGLALGLWAGLVVVLAGRISLADVGGAGYAIGVLAGGVLAYGIGRLVKGR